MAKDNDIIDFMLKTLGQLVVWVFKTICKLIWWILKGIYNLIAGKKNTQESVNESAGSDEMYSYGDCIKDIENAALENSDKEELKNKYEYLFVNTALNGNMSVDEKCRSLELLNRKVKAFFGNGVSYAHFGLNSLRLSFKMLEQMYGDQSAIVSQCVSDFDADIKNKTIKDFNHYFMDIFSFSGLLYSPNGEFTVEEETLKKYDLPNLYMIKV
jgi:hypothetical protein